MVRGASLVLLMSVASSALANPFDTFGYTPRAAGMGGAFTGAACSYEATYYNPAGLARLASPEVGIGVLMWRPVLHVNDAESPANVTRALVDLGFGTPIPLGRGLGRILFMGTNLAFPGGTLYAIRAQPLAKPHFPFLEDRNRRLVFNLALAVRVTRVLSIGAGISLLPDVSGDVNVDLTDAGTKNAVSVDADMHLSPNVGVLVEPMEGLTVGLTWRGANRTYLKLPVSVFVGESSAKPINIEVLSYDYSTPHQLALGAAFRRSRFEVALDVTYSFYRYFNQSSPTVNLLDSTGKVTNTSAVPNPNFRDTWAVRMGGEVRVMDPLVMRAGFGFVQSPVPAQTGETNLLDGHRFTLSLGAGFDMAEVQGPPVVVDAHFAWTKMQTNRDAKSSVITSNPGYPTIEGSGSVFFGGVSAKVRF